MTHVTRKKALSWLLCLALVLGLLPRVCLTAYANTAGPVSYRDVDGKMKDCASYTEVTSSTTTWNEGWYVVDDEIYLTNATTVNGNVKLILGDNAELSWNDWGYNIEVTAGSSLTVYGQEENSGVLDLRCAKEGAAVNIGSGGSFIVNGGIIEIENDTGTGIEGDFTVNGGSLRIQTGSYSSVEKSGAIYGNVTMNGGQVKVVANIEAVTGNVTVNGGSMKVDNTYGSEECSAIKGNVVVNSGKLTVLGKVYGIDGNAVICGDTGGRLEATGYTKAVSGTVQSDAPGISSVYDYETYVETRTIFPAPTTAETLDYSSIQIPGLFGLWVGEAEITTINYLDISKDGSAAFDPDTNTLTLDGYHYDGVGHIGEEGGGVGVARVYTPPKYAAAISYEGYDALTIVLKGENSVKAEAEVERNCGIFSVSPVSFVGSGSLTATGGDLALYTSDGICCNTHRYDNFGGSSSQAVTFSGGCSVTAVGGTVASNAENNEQGFGQDGESIGIEGSIMLNDATVEAHGNTIGVSDDVIVDEGMLKASGDSCAVYGMVSVSNGATIQISDTSFDQLNETGSYEGEKFVVVSRAPSPEGTVKLSDESLTIVGGESAPLTVSVKSYDTEEKTLSWSVPQDQEGIISLYSDAECTDELETVTSGDTVYVLGMSPGTAMLTFTNDDNTSFSAVCTVTVLDPAYVPTLNDGTDTNQYVPVEGYYADNYLNCQFVIPASDLSSEEGNVLRQLRFYTASPADEVWDGAFEVYVGAYGSGTISGFQDISGHTLVYQGGLDGTGEVMDILFSSDYLYEGGNLLITVREVEPGSYDNVSWFGVSREGASVQGNNSSDIDAIDPSQRDFAPKMTLYFAPYHEHAFTYIGDGATITATCSAEDCNLPKVNGKHTATLTIKAPATDGGAAVLESSPAGAFGNFSESVKYQSKNGTTWGADATTAPTAPGIHRASITLTGTDNKTATATVTYGLNCIAYATGLSHGTISGAVSATCGATVTPVITPDTGYELDTLTVTPAAGSGVNADEITVDGGTFVMPESDVTVSATFQPIDYAVLIASPIENGTVTASKEGQGVTVANYQDVVTLTVTPDEGYGLKSITTTSGTLVLKSVDEETGAQTYELTMGTSDVTVTVEFEEMKIYTIFYSASGSPDAVSIKFTGGTNGYAMTNNAKLGEINCWSTRTSSGAGAQSFSYSLKESGDADWKDLTIPVVDDIPGSLPAGSAVAIEGEVNAFVVTFVWDEGAEDNRLYYLVTSNTTSIDVPNPAGTTYGTFTGWSYLLPPDVAGGESKEETVAIDNIGSATTFSLDKINGTTIVKGIFTPNQYTVSFDPDNGEGKQSVVVNAKGTVTAPVPNPTKAGHEFAGWVLADNAVEMVGEETMQFSAGTAFDFNTKIINNLNLKAKWKHVHSYACLQLDDPVFDGLFNDYLSYKDKFHIKVCSSIDDYSLESHNFVNGRCVCGASILDAKVTLTKYVNGAKSEIKAVKNSIVSVNAPEKQGGKVFCKWQYSSNTTDGKNGTWKDLSTNRNVAFVIPSNVSVRAVYENEKIWLTINSFKYDSSSVAFQFNYSVPDGFTVVDGGLMIGDNVRMRFWDCRFSDFILGSVYMPSLRDAVKVYGGRTIADKIVNYQTINWSGNASPGLKALKTFGRTGTLALAWAPYTRDGYSRVTNNKAGNDEYNQATYPTYAMGYIICKDKRTGGYMGFKTQAISATLQNPSNSDTTEVPVS